MNKSHLVSCAACARHVRASESACPFCRAELPRSLREASAPRPPRMRLARAALMAVGAGAAAIATACGGNVGDGGSDAGGADHMVSSEPPYGAAPMEDGGDDSGDTLDAGMVGVLYGGVFPGDAAQPDATPSDASADASQGQDAGPPQDSGAQPPYGAPPPDPPPPPPSHDPGT
jgi:hypothetical protein